jgi:intracellular sulfur oxidation DsrE/DsrF family protein
MAFKRGDESMLRGMLKAVAVVALAVGFSGSAIANDDFAPYGTAKVDMRGYPKIDTVFDVNYQNPKDLSALYSFVINTQKSLGGRIVVVTHGPELRAFAKENYETYQAEVQHMAELAEQGVEFRMCNQALRAAGYEPQDMHGFITVVPAGFAEIARLQHEGFKVLTPLPHPVRDVRYLEHPELKKG